MCYLNHIIHPLPRWAGIAALFASVTLSFPVGAATYTVTNLDDSGPGSLRQAVLDANASFVSDTINFDSSLNGAITLTNQITITDKLTINGSGADKITISGNKKVRIFFTDGSGVIIQDLTLRDGLADHGGAIYNKQQLTLNRLSMTGNASWWDGGAVYNKGVLTADHLTVWENGDRADSNDDCDSGCGIYNTGTLTITNSNFWKNKAESDGGAIWNDTNLTISNSFIGFNSAERHGGGIRSSGGKFKLNNSTISDNTAQEYGGGICTYRTNLTILNTTIAGNATVEAGGGMDLNQTYGTIGNSIVSGNAAGTGGVEIDAAENKWDGKKFVSVGGNLFGVNGKTGVDSSFIPLDTDQTLAGELNTVVGEIGENEDWPYVRVLVSGSQAIDGGINELVPAELTTDQRGIGFPRIVGDRVDIGAFEAGGGAAPTAYPLTITTTGKGSVTSAPTGVTCSGATCSGSFSINTEVTLTAKPLISFTFSGWSGACTNKTGTCTVTMDKAQTVTATFTAVPVNYSLTLTKIGNGTVTSVPAGINCGIGTGCAAKFASGKVVTLTAIPATGATFLKWTGCTASATDSKKCTLTLTANKTVIATFSSIPAATADFIITNINLTPVTPVKNGLFYAKITVKNKGTSAADGGTLSVWPNRATKPVCSTGGDQAVMVGKIDAGKTKVLTIKELTASAVGAKILYAFVDSKCVTQETDETNNQRTKSYTVIAQ
jgi:uncharacterized repeat protein (TIGR02543 family)